MDDLYTVRHGLRKPRKKTEWIDRDAYILLLDCCKKYKNNLIHEFPKEVHDNFTDRNYESFNDVIFEKRMKIHIPDLLRDRDGKIREPYLEEEYNQYALLDLIEFHAKNIKDIRERWNNDQYRNFKIIDTFDTSEVFCEFQNEINKIFSITGLLYTVTDEKIVERVTEFSIIDHNMEESISQIKEDGLKELLQDAIALHRTPHPSARQDAVEKLWDALERLKTYYGDDKKYSVRRIIDDISLENNYFKEMFDSEFRELTKLGNECRIRHHEKNKVKIKDIRHYDYLFNRGMALIALVIQYLE